jgi:hypothetical protein
MLAQQSAEQLIRNEHVRTSKSFRQLTYKHFACKVQM